VHVHDDTGDAVAQARREVDGGVTVGGLKRLYLQPVQCCDHRYPRRHAVIDDEHGGKVVLGGLTENGRHSIRLRTWAR